MLIQLPFRFRRVYQVCAVSQNLQKPTSMHTLKFMRKYLWLLVHLAWNTVATVLCEEKRKICGPNKLKSIGKETFCACWIHVRCKCLSQHLSNCRKQKYDVQLHLEGVSSTVKLKATNTLEFTFAFDSQIC